MAGTYVRILRLLLFSPAYKLDTQSTCVFSACGTAFDGKNHFIRKQWPARTQATLGRYNIKNMPLGDPNKILLPPLHIKLGLMKTSVKELGKREGRGLKFPQDLFGYLKPLPSWRKMCLTALRFAVYYAVLRPLKRHSTHLKLKLGMLFCEFVSNFLGNNRSEDYIDIVERLIGAW